MHIIRYFSLFILLFSGKNLYISCKNYATTSNDNHSEYLPLTIIHATKDQENSSRQLTSSASADIIDITKAKVFSTINERAQGINKLLKYEDWSMPHKFSNQAIFTCALSLTYIKRDAKFFVGTARKTGFQGDIVVAVRPESNKEFLNALKGYNATVYTIPLDCSEKKSVEVNCKFMGEDLSISLIRYFIYQSWALKYPETSYMMISDFRDVIFQSNPFTIKNKFIDWGPNVYDLVLFNEPHPNRVISRCPRTGVFFVNCYGKTIFRQIGSSIISSNGIAFARRDALVLYSDLIIQQRMEVERNKVTVNFTTTNKHCYGFGVDLVFHNYLLYSGILHRNFKLKVFPQGEGPVNTVGGFYGDSKILRATLSEWRIVRGDEKFKYIYNWNGEISSVVHQLDRFLSTEFQGGYRNHLAVFQHLDP